MPDGGAAAQDGLPFRSTGRPRRVGAGGEGSAHFSPASSPCSTSATRSSSSCRSASCTSASSRTMRCRLDPAAFPAQPERLAVLRRHPPHLPRRADRQLQRADGVGGAAAALQAGLRLDPLFPENEPCCAPPGDDRGRCSTPPARRRGSFFYLLHALFKSIGGGKFEQLCKEFHRLLPPPRPHPSPRRRLAVGAQQPAPRAPLELCLALPARLSTLPLPPPADAPRPTRSAPAELSRAAHSEFWIDHLRRFLQPLMAPRCIRADDWVAKQLRPAPHASAPPPSASSASWAGATASSFTQPSRLPRATRPPPPSRPAAPGRRQRRRPSLSLSTAPSRARSRSSGRRRQGGRRSCAGVRPRPPASSASSLRPPPPPARAAGWRWIRVSRVTRRQWR